VTLADRVIGRMLSAGYTGRTIVLRLRFADFSRATRSRTLPEATAAAQPILAAARILLDAAAPTIARQGLTLIGLTVTNVVDVGRGLQLELPVDGDSARHPRNEARVALDFKRA
ncbi:MAG: DNA polymerase IV, partial [Actinomycetota bacterium]|nr:DNA polymerase IV [Actinomycetota bacterium]